MKNGGVTPRRRIRGLFFCPVKASRIQIGNILTLIVAADDCFHRHGNRHFKRLGAFVPSQTHIWIVALTADASGERCRAFQ